MKIFAVIFCLLSLAVLAILPVLAEARDLPSKFDECGTIYRLAFKGFKKAEKFREIGYQKLGKSEENLTAGKHREADMLFEQAESHWSSEEKYLLKTAQYAQIYTAFCKD
tara:strand:- start:885 stop:1214 length:330 start_codon:yes stop_codon:yes gene_type:complete